MVMLIHLKFCQIILRARPPEEAKFKSTHQRLMQSGYKFVEIQETESVFTKERFPHFDHNTFFCGDRDKGEVALEAIEALYEKTATEELPLFVFTDDLMENLISIDEALKGSRYKFVLYHFRAIDHKLAPYLEDSELLLSAIKQFQFANKKIDEVKASSAAVIPK